ncbi:MAG: hypothetical protein ABEI13_03935 [Candidatus Paceibacteria bacterium]
MPKNPEQLSLEKMTSSDRIHHLEHFPTPRRAKNRIPLIYLDRNITDITFDELNLLFRLCSTKEGLLNLSCLVEQVSYTDEELELFKQRLNQRIHEKFTQNHIH